LNSAADVCMQGPSSSQAGVKQPAKATGGSRSTIDALLVSIALTSTG
jgi:hypothetical protein